VLIVGVSVISLAVARAPVVRFAPIVHPESHLAQALIALVTLTLLFNVFFNYYHAIVGQPGSVAHLPKPINPRPFEENETETTTAGATSHDGVAEDSEDTAPEVTRGTFAGCRLCVPCGGAKPRGAHHCRTCRTCVRGMDHHCPFIANCVGADNTRHFMLFCLYVAVGCGWSLAWAVACAKADADGYRTFMDALFDSSAYGRRAVDVAGERGGSLEDLAKVGRRLRVLPRSVRVDVRGVQGW
jgi:palmitoyltransferase